MEIKTYRKFKGIFIDNDIKNTILISSIVDFVRIFKNKSFFITIKKGNYGNFLNLIGKFEYNAEIIISEIAVNDLYHYITYRWLMELDDKLNDMTMIYEDKTLRISEMEML